MYLRISLLLFILFFTFSSSLFAQDSWEQTKTQRKGKILVFYYVKSFPFIYRNEQGNLTGIEYELMKNLAHFVFERYNINLEVTFQEVSTFKDVYQRTQYGKSGTFGAASFSITEKRKQEVSFTPAFMPDIDIMICSDNVPVIKDSTDIKNVIKKLTGLYVPQSTSELHAKEVKDLVPSLHLEAINDFDLIRKRIDEEKNLFTFISLDNYIYTLKKGRTIRRQNIFRIDNQGHALILPLNNDWHHPIKAYFQSDLYKEVLQNALNRHLEKDAQKLYFSSTKEQKGHETLLLKMENNLHQLQNKQRELELSKQNIQRNFLVFGIIFVLVIAGFLVFTIYQKQQTNMLLQEQNDQIMSQKAKIESQRDSLNIKQKQITDSIRYAQDIQRAILPFRERIAKSIDEFFILFRPKDIVSGDFYWFSEIEPKPIYKTFTSNSGEEQIIKSYSHRKIIFIVADCTGHGVPGAFMSMIGTDFLNNIIIEKNITSPDKILHDLHIRIRHALKQEAHENKDGMDIAIAVWSPLDNGKHYFEFAGAKRPLYYIRDKKLIRLKGSHKSVGGRQKEKERHFDKHSFTVSSPFTFYLGSDGFQDQFCASDQRLKYGIIQLQKLLEKHHELPLNEQRQYFENELDSWKKDAPQVDDILLTGFRI